MTVDERLHTRPGEARPGHTRPGPARTRTNRVGESSRRLVVVSNRVGPIAAGKASEGGLAVALRAALESRGGLWFGYSGTIADRPNDTPKIEISGNITAATLDLTRRDFEEYYVGYANRVLWPLFHYRPSLVGFSRRNLDGYVRVNRKFARALAPMLASDDLVWVHDYHLIPLADELRRLEVGNTIGFFLHTPFPAAEVLRLLPNHRDLVAALCAYDLVGFQTITDLHGFRDYLLRWCDGEELPGGAIRAFGRIVRAAAFPVGIDVEGIAAMAAAAESSRQYKRLCDSVRDRALLIGVDRLDYSKGLPQRFAAYASLLEHYPLSRGRTVFLQIAPPSRADIPEYQEIRHELEAAAGRINGRFAEFDWTPLRYLNKSFTHRILTGFYRAAKLALVTPLRDGMNLVAKEYLAAQDPENPGMPILSCFAGAAHELGEAILVNPNDIEGVAEAIVQGLEIPLGERKERWNAMMATLRRNDADSWRRRFVEALAAGAVR